MTDAAKILVVDDEASIRFFLVETLERDGHQVVAVDSGEAAIKRLQSDAFDLALLDLKMRRMTGMEAISIIRKRWPDIIVIVLTAHASLETAVEALRQGAHDYLFKPCKTVELRESINSGLAKRQQVVRQRTILEQLTRRLSDDLAELRAVGRVDDTADRAPVQMPASDPLSAQEQRFLHTGRVIVDLARHVITLNSCLLELSPTEFDLLAYLVKESPRVISARELVREVQGYENETWDADEIARYHIYRIRRKIKEATGLTDVVHTVRGVGYTINE